MENIIIPEALPDIIAELTADIIRYSPSNIYEFASKWFARKSSDKKISTGFRIDASTDKILELKTNLKARYEEGETASQELIVEEAGKIGFPPDVISSVLHLHHLVSLSINPSKDMSAEEKLHQEEKLRQAASKTFDGDISPPSLNELCLLLCLYSAPNALGALRQCFFVFDERTEETKKHHSFPAVSPGKLILLIKTMHKYDFCFGEGALSAAKQLIADVLAGGNLEKGIPPAIDGLVPLKGVLTSALADILRK
ncbi:hypothetical protein ADUPG1_010014 [Aduncisulcus paluster]|uniref:Uncharacterized protein n=1 Tax=Aduncisulcus paluster TaxID=2918883 RepID=A0ABQ5KXJ7_9EUKA|nr:hypothetical protein ADUPG1_010014 [Aduncisulcus paluster]